MVGPAFVQHVSMNKNSPDNQMQIPAIKKRQRGTLNAGVAFLLNAILIVLVPALLGSVALLSIKLMRVTLVVLPGIKNATTLLLVFYLLFAATVLLAANITEAGRAVIKMVDHWAVRTLSVFVVGISDLARGRTWVAATAYVALGVLFTWVAFKYFSAIVDGTGIGHKTQQILVGSLDDFNDVLEALVGGALLALGVIASMLPIMMVLSRRWQVMLKRPKFEPLEKSDLAPKSDSGTQICLAHASDLHALAPEPNNNINEKLAMGMRSLAVANMQAILLTGDLTDNGTYEAWNALLGMPEMEQLRERAVVAPGNHDLNTVYPTLWETFVKVEHPRRIGTHARALNFLRAANAVMGSRAKVICPYSNSVSTLTDVMLRAGADIHRWENNDKLRRNALTPEQLLEKMFPMMVEVSGVECRFMVWNSVKLNRWPLLNAIGEVDRGQLERANALLSQASPNQSLIHLIHHQIGVPQTPPVAHDKSLPAWRKLFAIGMGLQNPSDFLSWLAARAQSTVVLHGHHHKYFLIKNDDAMTQIVSAPSLTHGVETSYSKDVGTGKIGRWLALTVNIDGPNVELSNVDVRNEKSQEDRMLRNDMSSDNQTRFQEWISREWDRCSYLRGTFENHAITFLMTANGGGAAALIAFAGSAAYGTSHVYWTLAFFLIGLLFTGCAIIAGYLRLAWITRSLGNDHRLFNKNELCGKALEESHQCRFAKHTYGEWFGWIAFFLFIAGVLMGAFTFDEFITEKVGKSVNGQATISEIDAASTSGASSPISTTSNKH